MHGQWTNDPTRQGRRRRPCARPERGRATDATAQPAAVPRPGSAPGERPRGGRSPGSAASRRRRGPAAPSSLLAVVCGGYAVGAALGWGSREVALVMGDFGLSAAAACSPPSPASSTPARRGSRFRPAWLLFALSSAMAACGNAVWGWYEVVLRPAGAQPLRRRPVLPLLRAARHRRPAGPRQAAGHPGRLGLPRRWTPG